MPLITDPLVADYVERHTSQPDELLYNIDRWTHLNMPQPRMIAGAYQGQLLTMLCQLLSPSRILEVGSYVGYSTICLARGLAPGGMLHAVEVDPECEPKILRHLHLAGLDHCVSLHIGDVLQVLPSIPDLFDLAFLDAGKQHTLLHYQHILPRLRLGGWFLVDNVLWDGKVASPEVHDRDTQRFREFNDFVLSDSRVDNILLPIRDGLMLLHKVAE